MNINVEITGMILRLGDTPDAQTYGATMYIVGDEGTAIIKAALSVPPGSGSGVRRVLRELGFHKMRWSHHLPDGTVEWEEHSLLPKGS